ncbi:hypothetical protein BDN72DRAFT_959334 [Pluteus cervinus]|uniref:Uncharacterized protein n=1 Tax=Pluteus cervinus TaxID=181527 RepID=A0ACD3AXL0_9AGAR|nr:hypothetical protein BDN72DRAFT_959334 [Pluteus cervinus]
MSSPVAQTYPLDPYLDARRGIDQEITQLETRLIALKLARNGLAPIARLHSDILRDIFSSFHRSSLKKGKASLLINWISHHWRKIAHNTSDLWTYIDFSCPEWVEAALSRTSTRELHFNFLCLPPKTGSSYHPLARLCLGNLDRIKTLKISSEFAGNKPSFPALRAAWATPAPHLVELHLEGIYLPPKMFSGTCPSLQILHLSTCRFDVEAFPVTLGLKKLSIEHPHSRVDLNAMSKILTRVASSLEELTIKQGLDISSGLGPHRIQLNQLISLCIQERWPGLIEGLIHGLSLPCSVNTDICLIAWRELTLEALLSARDLSSWEIIHLESRLVDKRMTLHITEEGFRNGTDPTNNDHRNPTLITADGAPTAPIRTVFSFSSFNESQDSRMLEYFGTQSVRNLTFGP